LFDNDTPIRFVLSAHNGMCTVAQVHILLGWMLITLQYSSQFFHLQCLWILDGWKVYLNIGTIHGWNVLGQMF